MSRLIDADKLYDYISDVFTQFGHDVMSVKDALEAVENAPTVNAVELPCKVGDTVYVLDISGNLQKMILDEPDIRCHCAKEDNLCIVLCENKQSGICAYRFKNDNTDIGKTVFLTREEAEQALRERELK